MADYDALTTIEQDEVLAKYQVNKVFTADGVKDMCVKYVTYCIKDGALAGFPSDALLRSTIQTAFKALETSEQTLLINDYIGK